MKNYKLSYFNVSGGRGESIRLAFAIGNIEFEDDRVDFPNFMEIKNELPLGQLPILDVDGVKITQSNAILSFVGKQAGLYPEDAFEALRCDEVLGMVEDIDAKLGLTMMMDDEAKKQAREQISEQTLPKYLTLLNQLLVDGKGHFAAGTLTVADLKVFVLTNILTSGFLDHISTTLVSELAPELLKLQQTVGGNEAVDRYYSN